MPVVRQCWHAYVCKIWSKYTMWFKICALNRYSVSYLVSYQLLIEWASFLAATFVVWWEPLQTVLTQIRTNRMIWIQTVWHSDSVPERFFLKKLILKKVSRRQQKHKTYPALNSYFSIYNKNIEACVLIGTNTMCDFFQAWTSWSLDPIDQTAIVPGRFTRWLGRYYHINRG